MIQTNENIIALTGTLNSVEMRHLFAAIHERSVRRGYSDLVLDMSACEAAFPGPMIAICSHAAMLRTKGVDIELRLPHADKLCRLFLNANWAYFIDPSRYQRSKFKGLKQLPATQYSTPSEQCDAVNNILDKILGSLDGFSRDDISAIEWSLNEISDNVINHAKSDVGGFVQLSTFQRTRSRIEYVVCDAGIGIPASLRQAKPEIASDSDAIYQSIREGVTRDPQTNQGNGLFGAFQISRVSDGYFEIHSGHGSLLYNGKAGLRAKYESIPFSGTLVVSCIDYSDSDLLGQALKFGGEVHHPVGIIESKYEMDSGDIKFVMKAECQSFGSRASAEPARKKLINLLRICGASRVRIDFSDIAVISSSFADEVFAKLFIILGPLKFSQQFEFVNMNDTIKSLIDRSILLRTTQK